MLLTGNNQTIYSSGTANKGTGPCQLVVSGAGGGGFAVIDSKNATLYSQGAYSPPGTVPGTLPANAVLTQVLPIGCCAGDAVNTVLLMDAEGAIAVRCAGLQAVLVGRECLPHCPIRW